MHFRGGSNGNAIFHETDILGDVFVVFHSCFLLPISRCFAGLSFSLQLPLLLQLLPPPPLWSLLTSGCCSLATSLVGLQPQHTLVCVWASLVAQLVKNPPGMWETWAWSLDWEDSLEKGTATHSSILTWRIPWTEEAGRLQVMGSQRVGHDWATNTFTYNVDFKK